MKNSIIIALVAVFIGIAGTAYANGCFAYTIRVVFLLQNKEVLVEKFEIFGRDSLHLRAEKDTDTVCLQLITWENDGDFIISSYEGEQRNWRILNERDNGNRLQFCMNVLEGSYGFDIRRISESILGPPVQIFIAGQKEVVLNNLAFPETMECKDPGCLDILK